jgi:hypothetical protein
VTLSVGPCVAVLPAWRIVLSSYHTGPCSESSADVFVEVSGGSHGLVL